MLSYMTREGGNYDQAIGIDLSMSFEGINAGRYQDRHYIYRYLGTLLSTVRPGILCGRDFSPDGPFIFRLGPGRTSRMSTQALGSFQVGFSDAGAKAPPAPGHTYKRVCSSRRR